MTDLEKIIKAIKSDLQNQNYTENGIDPLFAAPKTARINIVGQAPGLKTQEARLYWKDKSGIVYASGLELMKRHFTILENLLFYL